LCEVGRTYEPLTSSRLYQPHSDPSLNISSDFWGRIDPARYRAPVAAAAYETVLTIEHAAGLDPAFPEAFRVAIRKIQRRGAQVARDLRS
jgi:hypothetical protein